MRVPEKLLEKPYNLRSLKMDGANVIESCSHQQFTKGNMLVGEHLLLFVLNGKYIANFGDETLQIDRGEGLLIQRTHFVEYEKLGFTDNDRPYESLMFFLNDDLIKDFLSFYKIEKNAANDQPALSKIAFNSAIQSFLKSVLDSFNADFSSNPTYLQNKLFELLFNLSSINPNLINALAQFTSLQSIDLTKVMEENFRQNLNLEEFAYKAGRSLASFKRDFKKIYNATPHKWLMEKRLEFAKQLLESSKISISDACYDAGFETPAHFSRLFKKQYGFAPSELKRTLTIQ